MFKKKRFLIVATLVLVIIFNSLSVFAEDLKITKSTADVHFGSVHLFGDGYNINGRNYYKLLEVCVLVNINANYVESENAIYIDTTKKYSGVSVPPTSDVEELTVTKSTVKVYVDGKAVSVEGYNINGNNFFQLNDLCKGLNYKIDYIASENRISVQTSTPYEWVGIPISIQNQATTNNQVTTSDPIINASTTGTKLIPISKPVLDGAVLKTNNGDYVVKKGKPQEQPLPEWLSEWDSYPEVIMPNEETIRKTYTSNGMNVDTVVVFNDYETQRIINTIYKYAKQNPSLWKDKDPSTNIPNFTIEIVLEDDMTFNLFYPWRDSEVEKQVLATGGGKVFRIYAFDDYNNGVFLDTVYHMK